MIYDTIVIGAGYAGLTAAKILKSAGKNIKILEARDRVGGRVFTQSYDGGFYLDLGGAWVGPGQNRFYKLIKETGNSTFKTFNEGKSVMWFGDKVKTYKGLIPPLPVGPLLSLDFGIKKINRLSKGIDLTEPWSHPKSAEWDGMTLHSWLLKNMPFQRARDLFKIAAEAIWAADPNEISFLHALFYTKSGENLDVLMNVDKGAQEERIVGGAQMPALKLAAELSNELELGRVAKKITQNEDTVIVTGEGFSYECKTLIIAIPPNQVGKIQFEPMLPANKTQLYQRMPMGTVTKTYAVYPKPFWREKGLNGLAATNNGFTTVTFDNSPKDGSKGILMGFVLANQAKTFANLSPEERKSSILGSFTKMFGEEAGKPEFYLDHSWVEEEFTGGCYAALMPPGVWTSLGHALREVSGRIHWAGTETATHWMGYIDGAIQSGERAAEEILKR